MGGIQLGNYFMKSMSPFRDPDIVTAIAPVERRLFFTAWGQDGDREVRKVGEALHFGERTAST